jgi:hypothetical protein
MENKIETVVVLSDKSEDYITYIINQEIKKTTTYKKFKNFIGQNFSNLYYDAVYYLDRALNFVIIAKDNKIVQLKPDDEDKKDYYKNKHLSLNEHMNNWSNKEKKSFNENVYDKHNNFIDKYINKIQKED